ncbi:MAG: hypothetical protein LJE67_06120 [Salaquimonas sp.]|nr:hypothetical protein [Salaquimonas sp.]
MMFGFGARKENVPVPAQAGPVLDLSGPRLRRAFENLVESAEASGGVERYVSALALKASLFAEVLGKGKVREITETEFCEIACFMAPVRRRIGPWLADNKFEAMRKRIETLLEGWSDTRTVDARIDAFVASFPQDREHRWIRDLAGEILHFTAPDRYPLMTRWIWDQKTRTGVIREIWHADDVDTAEIEVENSFTTYATLREELEGFLAENGVFRDTVFYVDLLCAHVYAGYINDRGGQYLRPDFCGGNDGTGDAMLHTRRMLGLDAVDTETGRTRLKLIDGKAYVLGDVPQLN